jgi:hypothetical protein
VLPKLWRPAVHDGAHEIVVGLDILHCSCDISVVQKIVWLRVYDARAASLTHWLLCGGSGAVLFLIRYFLLVSYTYSRLGRYS